MRLYDNDAYREDFVTGVYDVLSNDPTWKRADQIIQLFDNAPVVEESPNEPLTLEELREMDGEPVWCKECQCYGIVSVDVAGAWEGTPFFLSSRNGTVLNYNVVGRKLTLYHWKPESGGKHDD